jgi:manganese/iron transport system substrate-binding protein
LKRPLLLTILLMLVVACGGGQTSTATPGTPRLTVVATTTVFGDLVKQVGGDRVDVHSLVPKGGEVHTFDPAPSDAAKLTGARLLVLNGLGLDDWLLSFAEQAGAANVPVIELGEDLAEVEYIAGGEEEHPGEPAGEHRFNPHLWLNIEYARLYVDRIRLKLIEIDPAGQQTYDANAGAFDARLVALDASVRQQMSSIPADERRVVSFHDAFPYFAAAYDLEIVGVVVAAPGQEPSAAEVGALISAIREAGVKAILAESQFSDELAQTIAAETGATVVGNLYTDTLGDPPVDSYEAAMRYDVEQITAALR